MLVTRMGNKPEIYLSVQGEGKTIGKPSIFVRTAGCNLKCEYCDSAYSWKEATQWMEFSNDRIVEDILSLKCLNVVFTGGEPVMRQKDILYIMNKLRQQNEGFTFEVETNGTIFMGYDFISTINQINCSPKLSTSGNLEVLRDKPQSIFQIRDSGKGTFKFVISDAEKDMEEINRWRKNNEIPRSMIWLMPEGFDKEKIIEGTRNLADLFAKEGYNISTRLHVILWGNKKFI